ncbi:MAG: HAD family phosphatase [Anaerolineae bacterium]|nr:HAD family phosphatase [Anaerolineae bacterium]
MNLRLVSTDIDGTLVNDRSELMPETLRVLRQLLDRGVPVVLVTGLNPWPTRRYVEQIGHGIRAISLNGIFLLDNGEIHEGLFVDPAVARGAVEIVVAQGYVPVVYGADGVSRYLPVDGGMDEVTKLIAERPYQPYAAVETVDALFAVRPAQVSVCDSDARVAALHPHLDAAFGDRAYVVRVPGRRAWVEVNHPEARKDVALLALATRLGVAPDEIVYFGDSLNDLVVFRALRHCVAVDNARPEVKALAWRTAPSNNDDGVARVLAELFGLDVP